MEITESILPSIKKLLGIEKAYTHFDSDIIMHINSVFTILTQMGVGPEAGFSISDESDMWGDFTKDELIFESVKSYIYLKVKLLFDPPMSSAVIASMGEMIKEYEWRLYTAAENKRLESEES